MQKENSNKFAIKVVWTLVLICVIVGLGVGLFFASFEKEDFQLGVHFSPEYAQYLGLNWQEAYIAILDDLHVKNIRLAVPWDNVEPEKDFYTFGPVDWQIEEAQKRGVNVILTIGRRTPRWPECHDPLWIKNATDQFVQEQQFEMLKTVVDRYKVYDNIVMWQVENEPMLNAFGDCPPADLNLLQQEISFVKTLDVRPILITDSGELGFWLVAANVGDYFGTTMYRVTHNRWLGYSFYYLPPIFYNLKARLVGQNPNQVYVSELQAEPWVPQGILETSIADQKISMDAERLQNHVQFARQTGFAGAYLWGAEWWYWLRMVKGDNSLWDEARKIFNK